MRKLTEKYCFHEKVIVIDPSDEDIFDVPYHQNQCFGSVSF